MAIGVRADLVLTVSRLDTTADRRKQGRRMRDACCAGRMNAKRGQYTLTSAYGGQGFGGRSMLLCCQLPGI